MTEVAKMYGGSLYEAAAEEGCEGEVLQQADGVCALFAENPQYLHLLSMPNLPKKERCGLIDEAFAGQIHPYLLSFLKILCENGTLGELRGCAKELRARYNKAHGILEVTAVTAIPLSDEAKQKLTDRLSAMTGATIDLSVRVDAKILGGIRIDMGGRRLDGTVQTRLETLRSEIAGTVL